MKEANSENKPSAIEEKYDKIDVVGEGTYGVVYKSKCKATGEYVALKKIRLDHEDEGVPGTAIREVSLLRILKHPNVVQLKETLCTQNQLHLVFEYLDFDLKRYMKFHGGACPAHHIKDFMYQMLNGIAFCHSRGVIHRDLKPQNILIDRKTTLIKLADFGLARMCRIPVRAYTHEVVTLWFRPPEILLGSKEYSAPVDVWSMGCIFAELITGSALFPGDSEIDTLYKIFRLLGTPTEEIWNGLSLLPDYKSTFPNWKIPTDDKWGTLFPNLCVLGLDLMKKLLIYDPSKRISAAQALEHPYFNSLDKSSYISWKP